ncbi:MAG: PL29 family lyase N-terminal domain-containing protein [Candidatus Azobacteroides sp.]|nr:PL29 family lyase N-terminal domain-containing protein [Candidatus Azobacteroides sp.]
MKKFTLFFVCFCLFLSCEDDDWKKELEEVKNELANQKKLIEALQNGLLINKIITNEDGYFIEFSDGNGISIPNKNIPYIEIGENGNWYIDGIDTGKPAKGNDGVNGNSPIIEIGVNGNWYINGIDTGKAATGNDGDTPNIEIGENGNWYVNGIDTGKAATGNDGDTPNIEIGENGNWYVNGIDTGKAATGNDGNTPNIEIGGNGNWHINGSDTGVAAKGTDGQNAPVIISIVEHNNKIIFNFSDNTSITLSLNKKTIPCWGDSLTSSGKYVKELQELFGSEYSIINCGVGGENSYTIAGRQGGLATYLNNSITIPGDGSEVVIGDVDNSNISIMDIDGTKKTVKWLRQGEGNATINPVTIDDIECTLRWTGTSHNDPNGKYTIKRNQKGNADYTTSPNTFLFTNGMKTYRNPDAIILWIGQNGGWDNADPETLARQYRKMIEFANTGNYICIGLHTGTEAYRAPLEKEMEKEFGMRYINWREYCTTRALQDAGITPTQADRDAIATGSCPPSLLLDEVHLNDVAYKLLGNLIYKRFLLLGII